MSPWEKFLDEKIRLIAQSSIVVDVGGGEPFQKNLQPYQELFKKTLFVSVDYSGVFKPSIVGDAHCLPIKDDVVGSVICNAVLEHVYHPHKVVSELYRITKKNGMVLVYAPFLYAYHGQKEYKDYYRFTHDGMRELFKMWKRCEIQPVRGYMETITHFLPKPFKQLLMKPARFADSYITTPQVSGYYLFAIK